MKRLILFWFTKRAAALGCQQSKIISEMSFCHFLNYGTVRAELIYSLCCTGTHQVWDALVPYTCLIHALYMPYTCMHKRTHGFGSGSTITQTVPRIRTELRCDYVC